MLGDAVPAVWGESSCEPVAADPLVPQKGREWGCEQTGKNKIDKVEEEHEPYCTVPVTYEYMHSSGVKESDMSARGDRSDQGVGQKDQTPYIRVL